MVVHCYPYYDVLAFSINQVGNVMLQRARMNQPLSCLVLVDDSEVIEVEISTLRGSRQAQVDGEAGVVDVTAEGPLLGSTILDVECMQMLYRAQLLLW